MITAAKNMNRKVTRGKLRAPAQRVATDPRMRDDHVCVVAECDKPLTSIAVANEDPFCSTVCCRAYYGAGV